jgi:ketosteroid isomerase-like protein
MLHLLHGMEGVNGLLIFLMIVTVLLPVGCTRPRKETTLGATPDMHRPIIALRSRHAAYHRGNIGEAGEPFDAQMEWAEFPGGGTYHGREPMKRYLAQSRSSWVGGNSEPERFITAGSRIVVFVHVRARSKGSKEWNEVRSADVYTIRDGQPVQVRAFADRKEALGWAGVEDANL